MGRISSAPLPTLTQAYTDLQAPRLRDGLSSPSAAAPQGPVRRPTSTSSLFLEGDTFTPASTPKGPELLGGEGDDDTVAIIDAFHSANLMQFANMPPELQPKTAEPPHGEGVEYVVRKTDSQLEPSLIRRIDTANAETVAYMEAGVLSTLDSSTKGLQSILDNPGRIKVVNQSQSMSKLRLMQNLLSGTPPRQLTDQLGLPENASRKELLTALVKHVDKAFDHPAVREAKKRYDEVSAKLEKQGILHVIAAGNQGELMAELDTLGIPHGDDFSRSVLATPDTITVGASTGGPPKEERIAVFSNPTPDVTLAIDGTEIEVEPGHRSDGTSFAAPQVTALIAQMRRMDPSLTNSDVRDILRRSCRDTSAPATLEGAGILDPKEALRLTSERLKKNIPRPISP